jgi:Protein of unknown function (DUF3352)
VTLIGGRPAGGLLVALLAISLCAVALAACGEDESAVGSAREAAPADALLYFEAAIRPEGDQREQLDSVLERFGEVDPGELIVSQLDAAAAEEGVDFSYEEDIEPWLGERASVFFLDFEGAGTDVAVGEPAEASVDGSPDNLAVALESTDDEAAQAAVEKALEAEGGGAEESFDDHDYLLTEEGTGVAVEDGLVIFGAPTALEAAFETLDGGAALVDEESFSAQLDTEELDESLASLWVDVAGAVEAEGGVDEEDRAILESFAPSLLDTPVTATVSVGDDDVAADLSYGSLGGLGSFVYAGGSSPLLGELPADAWAATATPDLGESYAKLLQTVADNPDLPPESTAQLEFFRNQVEAATGVSLDQALGAIGDVGLFVRGTSVAELDGAMAIEIADEATATKLFDAARRAIERQAGARPRPLELAGAEGFAVRLPGQPRALVAALDGDRAVLGYGAEAAEDALSPTEALGDTDAFAAASEDLGAETPIASLVDLGPAIDLIAASQGVDAAQLGLVAPYLEPLDFLALGGSDDGEVGRSRVVVGLD